MKCSYRHHHPTHWSHRGVGAAKKFAAMGRNWRPPPPDRRVRRRPPPAANPEKTRSPQRGNLVLNFAIEHCCRIRTFTELRHFRSESPVITNQLLLRRLRSRSLVSKRRFRLSRSCRMPCKFIIHCHEAMLHNSLLLQCMCSHICSIPDRRRHVATKHLHFKLGGQSE